jgi:hypothetical protein
MIVKKKVTSDGMELRESWGRRSKKNYLGRLNFEAEENARRFMGVQTV